MARRWPGGRQTLRICYVTGSARVRTTPVGAAALLLTAAHSRALTLQPSRPDSFAPSRGLTVGVRLLNLGIDVLGVFAVPGEYGVGVADGVSHSDVVGEQYCAAIGWVVSGWSLERNEAVADLVAVHPRP